MERAARHSVNAVAVAMVLGMLMTGLPLSLMGGATTLTTFSDGENSAALGISGTNATATVSIPKNSVVKSFALRAAGGPLERGVERTDTTDADFLAGSGNNVAVSGGSLHLTENQRTWSAAGTPEFTKGDMKNVIIDKKGQARLAPMSNKERPIITGEDRVIDGSPGNISYQNFPRAAFGTDGTLYVVYESEAMAGSSSYTRVFFSSSKDGTNFTEKKDITGLGEARVTAQQPAIAVDGNGAIHVVWGDHRDGNWRIRYARSDNGGKNFTATVTVSTTSRAWEGVSPGIAVYGGTIHVVWTMDYNWNGWPYYSIWYANSSDGGKTFKGEKQVDSLGSSITTRQSPAIAVNSAGVIFVAWAETGAYWGGRSGYYWQIWMANSTDGGYSFSPAYRVTKTSTGTDWYSYYWQWNGWPYYNRPALVVDKSDVVYVFWTGDAANIGSRHIYESHAADGFTFTDAQRIDDGTSQAVLPRAATTSDGSVHVTWMDSRTGYWSTWLATTANGGASFWADVRVDDANGNATGYPDVAARGTNTLAVVWQDYRNEGNRGNTDIYTARSTDTGATFGKNVVVADRETGIPSYNYYPHMVRDSGGRLHMAFYREWYEWGYGWKEQLIYQYSDDGGATWSSPNRIDFGPDIATGYEPRLAVDANGVLHAVWYAYNYSNGYYNIYYSNSTDGGVTWRNATRVDTPGFGYYAYSPDIAVHGGIVEVVWRQYNYNWWMRSLYSRSTDGGVTFSPQFELGQGNYYAYYPPHLAVDGNGRTHIVWIDEGPMTNWEYRVLYTSTTDGSTFTDPVIVDDAPNYYSDFGSYYPAIAIGPDGSIHVAWSQYHYDYNTDEDYYEVWYSHSTDGTAFSPHVRVDSAPNPWQNDPEGISLAVDARGLIHVVWVDERDSWDDYIYYTRSIDGGQTFARDVRVSQKFQFDPYQEYPALVVSDRNVLIAWNDERYDRLGVDHSNIFLQNASQAPIILSDGTLTVTKNLGIVPQRIDGTNWLADVPAGAGLAVEFRTSSDGVEWGDWEALNASDANLSSPPQQYVQWRARFTGDGWETALLRDMNLTYTYYRLFGNYTSAPLAGDATIVSAALFIVGEYNGQSVNAYLSNDGGASWYPAVPGMVTSFRTEGRTLAYRLELVSRNTHLSPFIHEVTLKATTSSLPRNVSITVAGGSADWNQSGVFSGSADLAISPEKVNNYLAATQAGADGRVSVPILVQTSSPGTVTLRMLTVVYDVTPSAPVLLAPRGTVDSRTPTFKLYASDADSMFLRYRIELSTDNFTTVKAFNQSANTDGWSEAGYGSTATAMYTLSEADALSFGTTYQWRASVFDGTSWSALSQPATFTIPALPSVVVTFPGADPVKGTISITGTATDAYRGIKRVEVRIGEGPWQEATGTANWNLALDTRTLPNGRYTVSARATGGAQTSDPVSVTMSVQNPPSVAILTPASGTRGSAILLVSGTATSYGGNVTKVEFRVDTGEWRAVQGGRSWSFEVDMGKLKPGKHTISVRASDGTTLSQEQTIEVVAEPKPTSMVESAAVASVSMLGILALIVALVAIGMMAYMVTRSRRPPQGGRFQTDPYVEDRTGRAAPEPETGLPTPPPPPAPPSTPEPEEPAEDKPAGDDESAKPKKKKAREGDGLVAKSSEGEAGAAETEPKEK